MSYNYDEMLPRTSVLVGLVCRSGDREDLAVQLIEAGNRHGFQTAVYASLDDVPVPRGLKLAHIIIVCSGPFEIGTVHVAAALVGQGWGVSIAFDYADRSEMLSYRPMIETCKAHFGDSLNFLRPNEERCGRIAVSDSKVIDNAVCDSVRIKYLPLCVESCMEGGGLLIPEEKEFFLGCSELYERYGLFMRSASDGYFALRRAAGFLITATKTVKVGLDLARVSWVHTYDADSNSLSYSGRYLPSSDSVEAAIVFDRMPQVAAIVHTHASDLFTRNPQFSHKVCVPELSYGEAALGHALVDELKCESDGFVIMKEHGEVFSGATAMAVLESVSAFHQVAVRGKPADGSSFNECRSSTTWTSFPRP